MKKKCPHCGFEGEIPEGVKILDLFCGNCFTSMMDRTSEVEHNKEEIEKLKGLASQERKEAAANV